MVEEGVFSKVDFSNLVENFRNIGGFDVVLPFLLIFAVTFAVLDKIGLFGPTGDTKSRKINGIISLIMAAFLVAQGDLVNIIKEFLPRVSMVVLVLLMLLLVVGVFTKGSTWGGAWLVVGFIVAIGAVLWAILAAAEMDVPLVDYFTEQDIAVLLIAGVFVLVIWLIVKEPSEPGKGILDSLKNLGESLKGGSNRNP